MFLDWKSIRRNGTENIGFSVESGRIFWLCEEEEEQNGKFARVPSSLLSLIQSARHGAQCQGIVSKS